jgi:outer membrane immunogenic protein
MKKLSLALVVSAVTVSAASAHGISSGFYLGAHTGYGSTTAKYSTTTNAGASLGSANVGSGVANIGLMAGYGHLVGCLYVGGEIAYTFENTKISNNFTNFGVNNGGSQLKRSGYFNAALRGGYLFTPSTMGYVRLGGNWSKWKLNDAGITGNGFTSMATASGSKNTFAFAPGVGLETAVHRNVYLRVEYTYEFGPNVRATNSSVPSASSSMTTIRNQSGKIGLAYKF